MREIKFRAWDNDVKKMSSSFDLMNYMMSNEEAQFEMAGYGGNVLMQYTGLKDKNGKEIYEGDLLQFDDDTDVVYEVFYNDNEARFNCCRPHYKGNRCGGYIPNIISNKLWIVGNIYESNENIFELRNKTMSEKLSDKAIQYYAEGKDQTNPHLILMAKELQERRACECVRTNRRNHNA